MWFALLKHGCQMIFQTMNLWSQIIRFLDVTEIVDLCNSVTDIELLTVSVCPPKSTLKFCVALYYRPPSASVKCFDSLSKNLCNLNPSSFNYFVLIGDFNVNYFCTTSFLYTHLMYCLSPFNLTQVVQSSTRNTPSGSSLIDLIYILNVIFVHMFCSSTSGDLRP